jgi:hypothetical protein
MSERYKKLKKDMIKRKDGSYSQRGLWDNIRDRKKSGKKPRKPGSKGAPTKEAFKESQ